MVGQLEAPVYANALLYSWQRAAPRREAQSQAICTDFGVDFNMHCIQWRLAILSKMSKGPG